MRKKIRRLWEVITKEGLYTFQYLVRANLWAKASPDKKYKRWRSIHESSGREQPVVDHSLLFSVLLLGEGDEAKSRASLQEQTYGKWELVEGNKELVLADYLDQAKGEIIVLLCRGDKLAPQALQRLAEAALDVHAAGWQMFYSDEDIFTEDGRRTAPYFKGGYAPDTLRSFFYMGGMLAFRKELLAQLSYVRTRPVCYAGYLLALEASFLIGRQQTGYLPHVLYHRKGNARRPDVPKLAQDKKQLFAAYGVLVETEEIADCREVRVLYPCTGEPKVSIIIPSKDNAKMLNICLDSISAYTNYPNYELVLVDNGSSPGQKQRYEQLCREQKKPCSYVYEPLEFNFSQMCNLGAKKASGDYYLFLNDDIEITQHDGADWLSRLLGQAMQPHVGAVGAKLLYPGTKQIQHVGVVNYESGAAHILSKQSDEEVLAFGRNRFDYNYSVVTGACLLVEKDKFWKAGGFEEGLAVTFNDVELCFRLLKQGLYQVVRNDVVLYHHESVTRGEDALDEKKFLRHLKEREKLFELQPEFVKRDAFYSRNLTQKELDAAVSVDLRKDSYAVSKQPEGFSVSDDAKRPVRCTIEYAGIEQDVCVRGFAFFQKTGHNPLTRTYVVLKKESQMLYVRTQKVYNPTIARQVEYDGNLNFAEFYTAFPVHELAQGRYQIGVALRPFCSPKAYLHMTDTFLELSV